MGLYAVVPIDTPIRHCLFVRLSEADVPVMLLLPHIILFIAFEMQLLCMLHVQGKPTEGLSGRSRTANLVRPLSLNIKRTNKLLFTAWHTTLML
jgi:hypothetical protein